MPVTARDREEARALAEVFFGGGDRKALERRIAAALAARTEQAKHYLERTHDPQDILHELKSKEDDVG